MGFTFRWNTAKNSKIGFVLRANAFNCLTLNLGVRCWVFLDFVFEDVSLTLSAWLLIFQMKRQEVGYLSVKRDIKKLQWNLIELLLRAWLTHYKLFILRCSVRTLASRSLPLPLLLLNIRFKLISKSTIRVI